MTEKRSKYDTDPLDPDFVRRTEAFGGGATRDVERRQSEQARRDTGAEDPTRRLDPQPAPFVEEEKFSTSYPSVFVPPVYQPPPPQQQQHAHTGFGTGFAPPQAHGVAPTGYAPPEKPSQRPVKKLGIPENVALALPYAPFFIGLVAALIELLLVPRTETRARFHAAQGLALQLVILAGTFIFNIVELVTDNGFGGKLFWLASFIFLIVSTWRVWQGRPHHIAPLDDLTQKLNEKFEPRK